jgi:hypothetical protein
MLGLVASAPCASARVLRSPPNQNREHKDTLQAVFLFLACELLHIPMASTGARKDQK